MYLPLVYWERWSRAGQFVVGRRVPAKHPIALGTPSVPDKLQAEPDTPQAELDTEEAF